jgi:hypothetical protein
MDMKHDSVHIPIVCFELEKQVFLICVRDPLARGRLVNTFRALMIGQFLFDLTDYLNWIH